MVTKPEGRVARTERSLADRFAPAGARHVVPQRSLGLGETAVNLG